MELDWTTGKLAEGLRHYNLGEFFDAHEAWESVWLDAKDAEKLFLQALIQVAAAFHHYHRKNLLGTSLLLQSAWRRLESCQPTFDGIAVCELCADIREWLQALKTGDSEHHLAPPRIRPCIEQ